MIRDTYERQIDYMRISVIDRCNLRCVYCMPTEGVQLIKHRDILTYEEIIRIVSVAAGLGVRKIRITGGEPLVRRNLPFLISSLNAVAGIEDISMTTNGVLLARHAESLAEAGLRRVNISLDSLRPDRFSEITRGGDIKTVLDGIHEAERLGLAPIKLNMVPVRGINDDEIEDFARLTMTTPYHVRFIEFMPIGPREMWSEERYVSTDEIKRRVSALGPLSPVKARRSGPARYFRYDGAPGVVGFISPLTHHFCESCNRLRLTSDGKLRPCLFSETEIDLRSALRSGAPDQEIERLLKLSVEIKPRGHTLDTERAVSRLRPMSRIGG
ncbi:MAG TPA: GTP 3',8-cyclase MoaA [Dissulfurispiraceae bacterium]|nr:GTP 3',8-cyclase MoaA [Dissulfurispiraceae bacterium]